MKKIFLIFCLVLSLVFPLSRVGAIAAPPKPYITEAPSPTPTPTAVVAAAKKVEYLLPYPGILPDNPLYWLKRIRDAILDKLIVDPVRRIEFLILQADKRLGMGTMLFEQNKAVLAEQTISKGEVYLEQAVNNLRDLKQKGDAVPPYVIEKITLATQKHIEVLNDLLLKANEAQKTGLRQALERSKAVLEIISKISQ